MHKPGKAATAELGLEATEEQRAEGLTRRQFLEAGLAAGAAGIVGVPLTAGAQAAAPKRGGVLKIAVPSAARPASIRRSTARTKSSSSARRFSTTWCASMRS